MPITLVETVGAADANTYVTLAEADIYFEAHPYPGDWLTVDDEICKALLVGATRLLDVLAGRDAEWTGAAASATQRLAWPRSGMTSRNGFEIATTEIPRDLKEAQMELARGLHTGDTTADSLIESLGLTRVKAGPIDLEFSEASAEASTTSHAIPDAAWDLLPRSWYTTDAAAAAEEDILFESM